MKDDDTTDCHGGRDGRDAGGDRDARLEPLRSEHARLQESMADPALHDDPARARRVGRRYAEVDTVLAAAADIESTTADLETARELIELGEGDDELTAEAEQLTIRLESEREHLEDLLAPRDPDDARDAPRDQGRRRWRGVRPVRGRDAAHVPPYAGAQGLARRGPHLRGVRARRVQGRHGGDHRARRTTPADGVYAHLKHEAGVHRVQRVPGHRVRGAHPHLRGGRAGAARG